MDKFNLIFIMVSMLYLTGCGGGGGSTQVVQLDVPINLPVSFSNTSSDFTQYEAVVLEVDECQIINSVMIGSESIAVQDLGLYGSYLQLPVDYAPGSYQLNISLQDICATTGDIYSDVSLDFNLQPALSVTDPADYLTGRINGALTMLDELLLTETDANMISYLTQLRLDLNTELSSLSSMSPEDIQAGALYLFNNETDLSALPAGAIVVPERFTCTPEADRVLTFCRLKGLVSSGSLAFAGLAGSWTGIGAVVAGVSIVVFLHHLEQMAQEAYNNGDGLHSDTDTKLLDESGTEELDNYHIDGLTPISVAISASNRLKFAESSTEVFTSTVVESLKEADKTIMDKVKRLVSRLAVILPSSLALVSRVDAINTDDIINNVADMSIYSVVNISDSQLEASVVATGNKLAITFTAAQGAIILNDLPFTFTITDLQGTQFLMYATYTVTCPDISGSYSLDFVVKTDDCTPTTVGNVHTLSFNVAQRNCTILSINGVPANVQLEVPAGTNKWSYRSSPLPYPLTFPTGKYTSNTVFTLTADLDGESMSIRGDTDWHWLNTTEQYNGYTCDGKNLANKTFTLP